MEYPRSCLVVYIIGLAQHRWQYSDSLYIAVVRVSSKLTNFFCEVISIFDFVLIFEVVFILVVLIFAVNFS